MQQPAAMSGNRIGRGKGGAARPVATCMAAAIVCVVVLLVAASALLFLLSSPPPPATGVPGNGPPREPVELAIGLAGHERWLDALRAWAKLACFNLRRPPAEPRYHLPRSPAASVTKAAKSTLEMGKEMVEKLAESAARATEEALERTTEKVRRKVSPSARRPDGDL